MHLNQYHEDDINYSEMQNIKIDICVFKVLHLDYYY